MSRLGELSDCIRDLRDCAENLNQIANWLFETFSADEAPPEPAKPKYTLESVRAILAEVSRAGHTAEIRELLQKHGASRLSEIDPSYYEALVADVEGLTDG
jgi:hypothetical protein